MPHITRQRLYYIHIMINTKNTHNESRHKIKTRLCLLISGALSYTWHVQGSLHSGTPTIFYYYVAWTLIPKSATPVVPLHHGRYWNRLVKGSSDWFLTLPWDTYLSPSPSHHLQSQWWFGILFTTPHIPGGKLFYNYIFKLIRLTVPLQL